MIIYSEKTKQKYDSVEACEIAEREWDALQEKKKEEARVKAEERRTRAKEVEDAYKAAVDAEKEYIKLRNKFIKDYGSFHMTYSNVDEPVEQMLAHMLSRFF